MKKTTVSIILAATLGIGGFATYKNFAAKSAATSTTSQYTRAKVSLKNIKQSVSGSGSVETSQSEVLKADSRDTVDSILVSKNQAVTKGQKLITFENGSDSIVAPYDGIVSEISVSEGDKVSSDQELITIVDNKNLVTTISVDETDLVNLKKGQKADIKVNAYPDTKFTGRVKDISQQGSYSNGVSNFDVTISFDSVANIKIGMSTEASIVTASTDNVLTIPVEAVKDIRGEKYVMLPNDNGASSLQKVTLGISNGKIVEVTNGLVEGEEVQLPQVQSSTNSFQMMRGGGGFQMMGNGGMRGERQGGSSNTSK